MSKPMVNEPRHEVDLSPASVSQCHYAPVSLDHYSKNGVGPWYRCHECNNSCAIRRIPSQGYDWCDNCNARGYVKVGNPLKLVGYDQTKLDRRERPVLVGLRKHHEVTATASLDSAEATDVSNPAKHKKRTPPPGARKE